jgi:hypothetical protein
MARLLSLVVLVVSLAAIPSCIGVGGTTNEHRPTMGQELIDLKTAQDRGAITQAEYDRAKAEILNRNAH